MIQFSSLPPVLRHIIIISILAIIGLPLGAFIARQVRTKQPAVSPSPVNRDAKQKTTGSSSSDSLSLPEDTTRSFHWGVTLRPLLFPSYADNEKLLPDQFKLMKDLGINTVRVDYSTTNDQLNQKVLDLAKQYNMTLVFIIPFGPNDIWTDKNLSKNAYNYVAAIAKKYKGRVPVWQLGTEVASVALIDGGHHGVDFVDYPAAKYKPVSTWLLSATKAIKDSDPSAKRLLNDQWVHVGFFDQFIKDGGDFDILGWNWFSDMGTNMDKVVLNSQTGQTYKLMDHLIAYGKPIWLSEVNRRGGSADGNQKAQADFIETMANYAATNRAVSGFLVFHLMGEEGYGLADIDYSAKLIGAKKLAFSRYQTLIKKYK